jgi:ribonuclease HI
MLPKIKSAIQDNNEAKVYPEFDYIMNFDGCSKGNPGVSGAGAVIYNDGDEIWCDKFFVGNNSTNNQAEYAGLILGMQQAVDLNIKNLLVLGDSQLVINHMNGTYKCLSPNLIALYEKAKNLETFFDKIIYRHVLRTLNKRADSLCNESIKNIII